MRNDNKPPALSVGIVTYHKSLSYGGCLQAYATQVVLEDLGCCPFFIDYENSYEARKKTNAVFKYGTMKERIASVVKRALYHQAAFQRQAFKAFHDSLPKTSRTYDNVTQLENFEADALLVASDQVWNPVITGGLDPVYLLGFGKTSSKISFASSLGSYSLSLNERAEISKYLQDFTDISVREAFACEQLQSLVTKEIRVVLDPTLQLSNEKWREVATQPKTSFPDNFILVFMVSSSPKRYESLLKRVREHYNLPVVQVRLNAKKPKHVDLVIPATPFELVWLIDHASFVLTDSFHGLAFSINMETQFTALPNIKNNVRLQELVDFVGLSDRLGAIDSSENLFCPVDFTKARMLLGSRRGKDKTWLLSALGLEGKNAQH